MTPLCSTHSFKAMAMHKADQKRFQAHWRGLKAQVRVYRVCFGCIWFDQAMAMNSDINWWLRENRLGFDKT